MAETGRKSIFGEEIHDSGMYRLLGLINGLLIGLALVIGAWGITAVIRASLPTRMPFAGYVLGSILVLALTGAAGWLTARFAKGWFTGLAWLFVAGFVSLIIGYETSYIRTWLVWIADRRFLGLPIYPLTVGTSLTIVIAGFFVFLIFGVLAVLQDYRLDGSYNRLSENNTLTFAAVLFLCLPLPIVILTGFITNSMLGGSAESAAIQLVNEVIQTGRTYEGDLFELSREAGINYNAIKGIREMMSENYTLTISGYNPASSTILVSADFDNGAWIQCRVVNDQLGFCSDASPPYTTGFSTLITGHPLPDTCSGCIIRIDGSWQSWLAARKDNLGSEPQMSKVAQWGTYTLMRAESPNSDYAIECWFHQQSVIELDRCVEANGN
ncbi:MAG: hypothetical protein WAM60_19850 [Candidatus Promineifilaceae bacterium]